MYNNMIPGLPHTVANNIQVAGGQQPTPSIKPKVDKADAPKHAINYYGDFGGCGYWRMQLPEQMINFSKLGVVTGMHKLIPHKDFYNDITSVRLQRQASPDHARFFKHIKNLSNELGFKMIYEIDDIVIKEDIPDFNRAKIAFDTEEVRSSILQMMNSCDVLSVTCDFMKEYYLNYLDHDNITVIPNMPSKMWMDGYYDRTNIMTNYTYNQKRPRILYAGSGNHFDIEGKGRDDDFTHVIDHIIKTRKQFKWIFMGSIPNALRKYVSAKEMEFYPWSVIMNYPAAIHGLKVNAVVAPLMDCTFNKAKSNIKYLESAGLGIPGVFQDLVTYKDAPVRFTDGASMIKKLEYILGNRQIYGKLSKQSRTYAETMWLDDHIDMYTELYFK